MSEKLPVNHFPGGIISWAPPSEATFDRCLMADLNAFVFNVFPSPLAPNSVKIALCFLQFTALYEIVAIFVSSSLLPCVVFIRKTKIAALYKTAVFT